MTEGTLYIGNRRYSSWSMRGWLAVKLAGLDVDVQVLKFTRPGPTKAIEELSPNGLVPFLEHNGARVWESLAICDYCAELQPRLWPADRIARAHARSISAEMHAGFMPLRRLLPMNVWRPVKPRALDDGSKTDVARIETIWRDCRERFGAGGPFLFGGFGAADAMHAPVVWRFHTYAVQVSDAARAYMSAMMALPAWREWRDAARREPWVLEHDEVDWPTVLRE